MLSKFQGYEVQRIARSQIQNAPYNPRRISAGNRERLAKGLQRHKLVMPPVWNKQTGNLVSGHQRLSILDEKHKGQDYSLDVATIDVPEAEEVQINILLNNESAMGEFDTQAVQLLSQEFEFDLSDAGFSREDLYSKFEFEDGPNSDQPQQESPQQDKPPQDKKDYTLQIVFPDSLKAQEFLRHYGLDATKRYFPADLFLESIGIQ